MAEKSQRISGVADRYAASLFDLASESNAVDAVAQDLDQFLALVEGNEDLKRVVSSPIFASGDQLAVISALVEKGGLGELAANFLKVVARNDRLGALAGIISAYHQKVAEARGEVTVEVRSAHQLTPAQEQELASVLSGTTGQKVTTRVTVDPSLLGGLIVRVGSRQIDTSLRTKLSTLKHALKEVG